MELIMVKIEFKLARHNLHRWRDLCTSRTQFCVFMNYIYYLVLSRRVVTPYNLVGV
jgi:hypothetical protein